MKLQRSIPRGRADVIAKAAQALEGLQAIGAEVGIELNTAARLAAELADFVGASGEAKGGGKRATFDTARAAQSRSFVARRRAIADGMAFCGMAVDVLKGRLGRRWNGRWLAVGFTHSLELPRTPVALLISLRSYFRDHPEHEVPAMDVTAARADTLLADIELANSTVLETRQIRGEASKASTAAFAKLRKRLTGLRHELDQLLSRDDERWWRFGFSRPTDTRLPARVEGLEARCVGNGMAVVQWNRSARAIDYRVQWAPANSTGPATELPLVDGLNVTLEGLPPGATIEVAVSARNEVGDTVPAHVQFIAV